MKCSFFTIKCKLLTIKCIFFPAIFLHLPKKNVRNLTKNLLKMKKIAISVMAVTFVLATSMSSFAIPDHNKSHVQGVEKSKVRSEPRKN